MQTILGAGGAIGKPLAKELTQYTNNVRLVSRNPKKINETDELFPADITDKKQVERAVEGSEVVYLTAGFPYKAKVWEKVWPKTMKNVVEACEKYNSKLVFFDNIYMYDKDCLNGMNEATPVNPISKKGKVRARIAQMLMDKVEKGQVNALIARAADFLGAHNSIPYEIIYKNLKNNKKAQWIGEINKYHNFTNTTDAARGTAMLGNTDKAYKQIWHLPTDSKNPITAIELIQLFAKELGKKPKYQILPIKMMGLIGLFNSTIKELKEMAYQYDRHYIFDSSKFENFFDYKPISIKDGVKALVNSNA